MFLLEIVKLGLKNLRLHLLRSVLTALGIILGVTAVITMVSIGEGSKREALAQLERLGAKNIIARSMKPPESANAQSGGNRSWSVKYGITYDDLAAIEANFPDAEAIAPLKSFGGQILKDENRVTSQAFGVTPELRDLAKLTVARGRYITAEDIDDRSMVAVVGSEVQRQLFPFEDPLGATLRVDEKVFEIVGVLAPVGLSGGAGAALVGRDLNLDVHVPISSAKASFGDLVMRRQSGTFSAEEVQVYEVYVASPSRETVLVDAARLQRLFDSRRDGSKNDVSLIVPYELLENARKSAMTWNLVLGSVAGISLLVGGIGIMNIMLANVTERTREIGVRRALGATKNHIVLQFLVETGVLSALGGLIGIGLGIAFSVGVEKLVPMLPRLPLVGDAFDRAVALPTVVTSWSIFVSFGVAAATGLIFGIYPATVAARQDPIVALRHD